MAEKVGFEPTCRGLADNPISSRARYDRTSVLLRVRTVSSFAAKKILQQSHALLLQYSAAYFQLVIKAQLPVQAKH